MSKSESVFTQEQVRLLKNSAEKLRLALCGSKDPVAAEFLNGELGRIIEKVLASDSISPFDDVPHFDKMTRDYLPDVEEEYFDFYSFAKYGKPAYES
ncbi:hypothetical protein [Pseudomonas sp.]|uniref:hypothetical protein n=1 Tax=Pseudomonas sp. TaxID=306 RepID=UPI003C74E795